MEIPAAECGEPPRSSHGALIVETARDCLDIARSAVPRASQPARNPECVHLVAAVEEACREGVKAKILVHRRSQQNMRVVKLPASRPPELSSRRPDILNRRPATGCRGPWPTPALVALDSFGRRRYARLALFSYHPIHHGTAC
ncbi:hypothetical protein K458DRAFT_400292 [Lentithecium fluviatile CBS 122367]|uniref:Uncharacterized protein n=1 Tax=Lentithecium fluviatile CBS 122367 TaxID=1168545 RepID=A0A6G1JGJ7_9PLEO|nr:hypothetical protein K458DRAFT_400292 [Lentithecium fluviatile CBS 122367]